MGLLTDRIGARRTGMLGLFLTIVPLLAGWLWADSFAKLDETLRLQFSPFHERPKIASK